MSIEFGTYTISYAAGMLSTLSPCVLPLIPILLGAAVAQSRLGPFALATGLATSFTVIGIALASLGTSVGLDQEAIRNIGAVLLILFGVMLVSTKLQELFAIASSSFSSSGQSLLNHVSTDGLLGQFMLGLLLGLVWTPCVGPTLGATITLASQGQNLMHTAMTMAIFGVGASTPLVILSLVSRQAMMKFRNKLMSAGHIGKTIMGILLLALGLLILSGLDKQLEVFLLSVSPDWLIKVTTSI